MSHRACRYKRINKAQAIFAGLVIAGLAFAGMAPALAPGGAPLPGPIPIRE